MALDDLTDDELLELFNTTQRELNDPDIPTNGVLFAARMGEIGAMLARRGVTPPAS